MFDLAADRELGLRGTLYDWLTMAWPHSGQATPFVGNWHIGAICEHLEAVFRGEIPKLLITMPPGTGKSQTLNVFFPTWTWLRAPRHKFLYGSFDGQLVGKRDGGRVLSLASGDWFRARWGKLVSPNQSAYEVETALGGFRFATTPKAKGMGRHADIVVCDDPTKLADVEGGAVVTKEALKFVSAWWSWMTTRRANPEKFAQILTMQRLHAFDLAGEMIATGEYTHLNLPMRAEKVRVSCDVRAEGELLFPQRFPESVVADQERTLGPTKAAAQLQQRPFVPGGRIFRRAWWRFWHTKESVPYPCLCDECFAAGISRHEVADTCTVLPSNGYDLTSWDMAFKGNADSDYVACLVVRAVSSRYFVTDIFNERLSFSETKTAFRRMALDNPRASTHLVEDKANGPAIESELGQAVTGIEMVEPQGGKEARAAACEAPLAEGMLYLPHPDLCPNVRPFLRQAEAFPHDVNDDMVDCLSQAVVYLRARTVDIFGSAMAQARREMGC